MFTFWQNAILGTAREWSNPCAYLMMHLVHVSVNVHECFHILQATAIYARGKKNQVFIAEKSQWKAMETLSPPSFFQSHFPEATICKLLCFVFWVFFTLIFNSILDHCILKWSFPACSVIKNLCANVKDVGLIPGLGSSPGEGNGNSL